MPTRPVEESRQTVARPGLWQWLAPAMALFVMALTLSTQNSPGFTMLIVAPAGRISELALKNPDLAAYFPSSGHSSHNGWPVATFDWTNKSQPRTTESNGWKVWATNALIQ
ncbi:MAG TPA: hypothetical protein VK850_11240 [Candidatus Binatia bacterium]|nr:hypothetical protein [Candidatus Binatia bacterium]